MGPRKSETAGQRANVPKTEVGTVTSYYPLSGAEESRLIHQDEQVALPAHQERTEPRPHDFHPFSSWREALRHTQMERDRAVEALNALKAAPARATEWQPLIDQVESEWAIKAVRFARELVIPEADANDAGTRYEQSVMNRLSATYRDGYLAAVDAVRKVLPPCALTGNKEAPRSPYDSGVCCMPAHANATPPWTCSCECHTRKDTEDQE